MLMPVPRAGRGPATDFTVLSSLVGGLLIWLVLASYALGRSQRQAVRHLQQDVARYVAGELGAPTSAEAAEADLAARPALAALVARTGVRLAPGVEDSSVLLATVGPTGAVVVVRASDIPGTGMAPGRPELLQAFVALALAATCVLGALLLVRLHRQHEETAARSDFVRVVSHELRTPLSQILMFAETVRLGRTRSERDRSFALDVILQEARRLARLVDNVLRFTRLEQGGVSLRQEAIDVSSEVRELAAQFAPAGHPDTPSLTVDAHTPALALGDRDALRQVLVNLFDNAIKHGGEHAQVAVTVSRRADRVDIVVEDNGPGIDEVDRERIWQPFGRGTAGTPADTGTGLGLTIVRGLVSAMDGTVRAEGRTVGVGARFVVSLRSPHGVGAESGFAAAETHT